MCSDSHVRKAMFLVVNVSSCLVVLYLKHEETSMLTDPLGINAGQGQERCDR